MKDWSEKTLGEFVSLQRGHDLPTDSRGEGNIPVIGSFGITGYHDVAKAKGPGVTVGRSGASAGTVVYVEEDYWPHNTCLFVKDFQGNNPRFAYYLLTTLDLASHAAGSAQPSLNRNHIAPLTLTVPERPEQDDIAFVLSALDDKIELNRRMNETLEALAQAIFKDWFVTFGPTRRKMEGATDPVAILGGLIPDPAKAAPLAALFPDSLGEDGLPVGWEEREIGKDFDVTMGQSPPGDTYNEAGNGLPFYQGRRDFGFRFPTRRIYCSAPSRVSPADWTLVSVRAPVGDINRAWEECCIGRGVGAFMHREKLASFTYYAGLHLREELASYDKDGTVFGSINQNQFKALKICGADQTAAAAFDDFVSPIDALVRTRTDENRILAETRDYLLPKLMSGAVRVRDAEKAVS